jgi:3-hydroxyisobutyrate dehydrogenase-like beta-hydroxyacid dehydrogenase
VTIGILHPGEMGAAIGAALVQAGTAVSWASTGRSPATAERAAGAELHDCRTLASLVRECEIIISVCPPHAALEVASEVASAAPGLSGWTYIDANAIAPATAEQVGATVARAGAVFVDGGIIGPPPVGSGTTRLYLSGPTALDVSERLATNRLELHVLGEHPGAASALKLAYAAWTKGSAALLLAARSAASRSEVEQPLIDEWRTSQPGLLERWQAAERSAAEKGWRWSGEMKEIASMFESCGLPAGFHTAAAQIFEDPTTLA